MEGILRHPWLPYPRLVHQEIRSPLDLAEARSWFPCFHSWAYLDFAGVAPVPQVGVDAVTAAAERQAVDGAASGEAADAHDDDVRSRLAAFVGAMPEEICFVRNTTEGLGWVANGLGLGPGDRVLVAGGEFPSAFYPWVLLREQGVRVDVVDPDPDGSWPPEKFAAAVAQGPAPAVVAACWVQFSNGWRSDLEALGRIAHDAGALFCADVIQGVGAIPLDLGSLPVDFAAADGHKWLCSVEGHGFLYVAREHLDELRPLEPGWNSVVHRGEWNDLSWVPDTGARRLEGGTSTRVGIASLGASLSLLERIGIDRIWQRIRELATFAAEGLAEAGMEIVSHRDRDHDSGIVTFRHPDRTPGQVVEHLRSTGVAVAGPRGGGVRVSPHCFCTEADVEALVRNLPR